MISYQSLLLSTIVLNDIYIYIYIYLIVIPCALVVRLIYTPSALGPQCGRVLSSSILMYNGVSIFNN